MCDKKDRGESELHMKCAVAEIYKTDAHRVMSADCARSFQEWSEQNNFRNAQDIGGSKWALPEILIYALFCKCILKATEYKGNYNQILGLAELPNSNAIVS